VSPTLSVDVWLRGTDFATTATIAAPARPPAGWTDDDVRMVLEGMLRAMDRESRQSPVDSQRSAMSSRQSGDGNDEPSIAGSGDRPIALRGLSWIVNPYEEGSVRGMVIAIEITLGAAIAGPFDIDKSALEAMITRVIAAAGVPPAAIDRVH
jgi:hypothetical protein